MPYLPLIMPTAPQGFCATLTATNWIQQLLNLIATGSAVFDTSAGAGTIVLSQETTPDPTQRGFLWFKPSKGRVFSYGAGGWTSPHPYAAGSPVRFWFEGTPADIWAFDGGDGSDPTSTNPTGNVGAMWIIDPNYAGRSPMGVGAIPTSNPAKNLSLSENFGEGAHAQTAAEVGTHSHGPDAISADAFLGHAKVGQGVYNVGGGGDTSQFSLTAAAGTGAAANVVHPVRGLFCIMRSGRDNYTP